MRHGGRRRLRPVRALPIRDDWAFWEGGLKETGTEKVGIQTEVADGVVFFFYFYLFSIIACTTV